MNRFFKPLPALFLMAFASFCFIQAPPTIKDRSITWGHKKHDGARAIDAVIIHSTYDASGPDSFSVEGVLKQFKQYDVSAHYLVGRDGTVYRLVAENDVSYHAGVSTLPDGRSNVNSTSIGIEVITTKYTAPAEAQYMALAKLVGDIKKRRAIKYIQGHKDIAPGRKTDPWNFDWEKFNALLR